MADVIGVFAVLLAEVGGHHIHARILYDGSVDQVDALLLGNRLHGVGVVQAGQGLSLVGVVPGGDHHDHGVGILALHAVDQHVPRADVGGGIGAAKMLGLDVTVEAQ